ncbi:MAG: integrase core domain-containing protein [Streptosporangiaceae bacterium]
MRTAVRAPRMNATCERLLGTLRREVLDRMLILGEQHLRAVLTEYQLHYNTARPHQGIGQQVPDAGRDNPLPPVTDLTTARIHRKPVLSGLINEYAHAA